MGLLCVGGGWCLWVVGGGLWVVGGWLSFGLWILCTIACVYVCPCCQFFLGTVNGMDECMYEGLAH